MCTEATKKMAPLVCALEAESGYRDIEEIEAASSSATFL